MVVNGAPQKGLQCDRNWHFRFKSQVSEVCQDLDQEVEAFRNRRSKEFTLFLTVDNISGRENNRIISKALMIAYGTNECGMREILGFSAFRRNPARPGRFL